jgi:hypothetical protein
MGYLRRAGTVVLQKEAEDTKKGKRSLIASLLLLSMKLGYQLNGIEPIVTVPSASSLT